MQRQSSRVQYKSKRGMTSLELASTSIILIVISIFSIDAVALMFGADFCDRACKDCARAAGQMATPDDAVNAMNAAAAAHPVDGNFITKMYPELISYQDFNTGTRTTPEYGSTSAYLAKNGPKNASPLTGDKVYSKQSDQADSPGPYVEVRTTLLMRVPIILVVFGTKLFAGNVESDPQLFRFQSSYTFPITNTYVPN